MSKKKRKRKRKEEMEREGDLKFGVEEAEALVDALPLAELLVCVVDAIFRVLHKIYKIR